MISYKSNCIRQIINCQIILKDAVCGGVELYRTALRDVSGIWPDLIDINGVDKIIEIPAYNTI